MSNPTIEVTLSSLDEGTVPAVTDAVHVTDGSQLDVTVTWPSNAPDTITVDLQFIGGDQDPFNDEINGDTNFQLTRAAGSQTATHTLSIAADASLTTDTYDLTLTINGVQYSKDPTIIIDED